MIVVVAMILSCITAIRYGVNVCCYPATLSGRRVDSPPVIYDSSRSAEICSFPELVCRQSAGV